MPRPEMPAGTSRRARAVLRAAVLALCAAGLLAADSGRAFAQSRGPEHPPPAPGGAPAAPGTEAVTRRVLCSCGCVNQTLYECTCGTAAMERDKIARALASGRTPDSIVEDYVQQYGLQILSAPDKTGFNLLGWMVPFIAAIVGLASLTFVLRGWMRATAEASRGAAPAPGAEAGEDREYRRRLEKEIEELQI